MKTAQDLKEAFKKETGIKYTWVNGEYLHEYGAWLEQEVLSLQSESSVGLWTDEQVMKIINWFEYWRTHPKVGTTGEVALPYYKSLQSVVQEKVDAELSNLLSTFGDDPSYSIDKAISEIKNIFTR